MGEVRGLSFVVAQDDQIGIARAIADTVDNITIGLEPPRISQSLSYPFLKGLFCSARI
jgi:hypothetical protein